MESLFVIWRPHPATIRCRNEVDDIKGHKIVGVINRDTKGATYFVDQWDGYALIGGRAFSGHEGFSAPPENASLVYLASFW